jgi:crotonobetainyl-CoA:carnitine CoA-transferase CaiB-like acyl-CoA transferase
MRGALMNLSFCFSISMTSLCFEMVQNGRYPFGSVQCTGSSRRSIEKQRVLLFKTAIGLVASDRFVDLGILHHSSPLTLAAGRIFARTWKEAQFPIHASRPTYGPVRTLDGDILIAPITPRNFAALCEVTGQDELSSDPRFNTVPARGANWTAMMQVIERWTQRHTVEQCMAALEKAGVPSAVYRDPGAALTDPHLLQRGAFATIADAAGQFAGVNAPWKMSGADTAMKREIPGVGAHRDEVLSRTLGLSADAIAGLAAAGAFGTARL